MAKRKLSSMEEAFELEAAAASEWSGAEKLVLMKAMRSQCPDGDEMSFSARVAKVDWGKGQKFRRLNELMGDAEDMVFYPHKYVSKKDKVKGHIHNIEGGLRMAAGGNVSGQDEGFAEEEDEDEAMEDEAMEVTNSAWEQEVDEVLSDPTAAVYFNESNPGVQGRGIAREEVEQMMQSEAYQRRIATCHLCGQCWYDGKMGLNCRECGGFALTRSGPVCEGQCHEEWRRNVRLSHSFHEAYWDGSCGLPMDLQRAFQWRKLVDSLEDTLAEGLQDLSTS